MNPLAICPWENATYLGLFSSNVPPILYYSHAPAMIVALLFALFVFFHSKKGTISYSLILIATFFSLWTLADLVLWATNRPEIVMFFWSLQILFEALIFLATFYLVYAFAKKSSPGLKGIILLTLLIFPLIILIPTNFNLEGVYLADCVAIENLVAKYYSYALEAILIISIALFTIRTTRQEKNLLRRRSIRGIGIGSIVFLLMFIYGNLIGSFLGDWELAQYGLFGMPIFVALLSYLIVRFKAFNIKLIGAQALVSAISILVISQYFFVQTFGSRVLVSVTLLLTFSMGIALIRGVKREIMQRERLEEVTKALAQANTQLKKADELKDEFLSFASHDLKSPVAKMKQWASLIRDKTYNSPKQIEETVQKIESTGDRALRLVDDFLNLRKIEEGQMEYNFEAKNIVAMAKEISEELRPVAQSKGLSLTFESQREDIQVQSDDIKMRQVVENLIDNSIKYTEEGSINVKVEEEQSTVLISITDTGIGMDQETLHSVFEQFQRAKGVKKKIKGTGLGLYIAKQIVLAHKGEIWAESEGESKGSHFFVRLPK